MKTEGLSGKEMRYLTDEEKLRISEKWRDVLNSNVAARDCKVMLIQPFTRWEMKED